MSDNEVFVSALANATGRPVEVSPVVEGTTLGSRTSQGFSPASGRGWTTSQRRGSLAPSSNRRRRSTVMCGAKRLNEPVIGYRNYLHSTSRVARE